jgi:uncharacterized membrane protein YdjX (TVP38/TMEM64 family)
MGQGIVLKRYWTVVVSILALLLILVVLIETLGIPVLTRPSSWLEQGGLIGALVGVGLLVVDVALPVPSSLVMVTHGALFGVVIGTILSLAGSTAATVVGFALGRRGEPLLSRFMSPEERVRADRLLARWGVLTIIVTRPVPLLAETTAIMAGASHLSWTSLTLAALAGSLPGALLYALTGAVAARFQNGALVLLLAVLVAGGFWLARRWLKPPLTRPEGEHIPRAP